MENELKKLAVVMRDMSDMVGDLRWMAAKAVEDLIKKDARIAELEGALSWHEEQRNDMAELRAELAAIKAQEPALPKDAIMVGRSELALVRNALALDCEQGRPIRGEMLAELDASIDRLDKLYAAPASEAKAQGVYSTDPLACSGCASGCFRCRDGAKAQGAVMLGRDAIREVFMSNGFTINEGQADLKPYVYAAAEELLRLAAPAAPAADAGLVLEQAMYTLISIGYHENSGLVHELRQALAAHRAKGVV